jgi:DNA-binding NarL/FixJ family response regulator
MDSQILPIRSVVILKSDRLFAEMLRHTAAAVFPHARISVAATVDAAALTLRNEPADIFVTGVGASLEGDVIELLARSTGNALADHVLVVTSRREYRVLSCLRSLDIDGVFDSSRELPENFAHALRTIATGGRYWSASILQHMHQMGTAGSHFRLLTTSEQRVLAVVGDGCDDIVAARELGLSPATVSTIRRELHRKLGVQHRGELVRVAAQNGFVRFTPVGIVRPGFGMLSAAYQARKQKRTEPVLKPKLPPPVIVTQGIALSNAILSRKRLPAR